MAAVDIVTHTADQTTAVVTGRTRKYYVDYSTAWGSTWLCTCGHAPDCSHVRAVKATIERSTHE